MDLFKAIIWTSLIGAPLSAAISWWLWARARRSAARNSEAWALLVGLMSASANIIVFYAWFICRLLTTPTPEIWKAKAICSDIAMYLVVIALAGAMAGEGNARIPLAPCAICGFLMWMEIGIL